MVQRDGPQNATLTTETASQTSKRPETLESEAESPPNTTACALCQVSFPNVQDQRAHVRSDFHRYNLKARLRGTAPVDEATFSKLIGDLDESISGSESSSTSDSDDNATKSGDTTLTALLKKQAKLSQTANDGDFVTSKRKSGSGKQPIYWFASSSLPNNTSLGIYRALFQNTEQEEEHHLIGTLRSKQLKSIPAVRRSDGANGNSNAFASSPHVFLCMIGGGHFAAMIVALAPELVKKQGGIEERQARVLAHKTFHRYTTRRKQGGSQSANDAAKGAAHSVGSSLRRANEVALENDIRNLLREWKSMIDTSQLLFVRASGSTNRRTLFGPYEGQILRQNDNRLRSFPFSTRRATQSELMRSFAELTRIKISQVDEAALLAAAEITVSKESSKPSKGITSSAQPTTPKLSPEDATATLHTTQVQALIRRSKAPAMLSYLTNNSLPPSFLFFPPQQNHHAPTPLHLSASSNSPALVLALLLKAGADPSPLNGDSKPAFDLAGDRPTRDSFRIARHELGEEKWEWDAAHIPPPLSKEDAEKRGEREQRDADNAEAERRKAETERLEREEAERMVKGMTRKAGSGRSLGAVEKTGAEKREEESRGLTPEMRMKLERERRARAAEERMRKVQGSR